MKKILFIAAVTFALSSCYNNRILVGDVTADEPVVEVQKQWNSHWLYGLIPSASATLNPSKYVGGRANYVVKTSTSFVNGLVGSLTWGIYTPTTTTFYVPLDEAKK
jgi:hypothetical protein